MQGPQELESGTEDLFDDTKRCFLLDSLLPQKGEDQIVTWPEGLVVGSETTGAGVRRGLRRGESCFASSGHKETLFQ